MIRIVLSLLLTGIVGCGSISHPLPKCDGYSRRPLNRSMWQWQDQDNGATRSPALGDVPAASYVQEPSSATPAAFAQFNVPDSYRPCEGK